MSIRIDLKAASRESKANHMLSASVVASLLWSFMASDTHWLSRVLRSLNIWTVLYLVGVRVASALERNSHAIVVRQ